MSWKSLAQSRGAAETSTRHIVTVQYDHTQTHSRNSNQALESYNMRSHRIWSLVVVVACCLVAPSTAQEKPAHDAVKPVPRAGGWIKRHESFNKRVAQGECDLIFIGDSITQGWERNGKEVWTKFYGERKAVNLGIGGDRTQHVIWRLDNGNLYRIKPKAAVIMIGTNNSRNNSSEQIAEGVAAIVSQLRKKLPDTKILLLATFPRGADKNDKLRLVNEGANKIVAKLDDGEHVHYLDIGPKFLTDDGTLTREIMPDLLHLSPKGYTIWAESIEKKLATLLSE